MEMLLLLATFITAGEKRPASPWDFHDASVGKLPPGWVAARTGKGAGSEWTVVEDKSAPKGSRVLAQTSADAPNSLFNLCVATESKFKDVDLSVSFKALHGEVDQGGGPVWRYQDANNYYVARMNPLEKNFRVYKVVGGKRIQLETAAAEGAAGKWHTIRVVHRGNHIQCYFNGKLLLDVKDDAIQQAGKIGLWTKADAQTSFADIRVKEE